MFILFNKAAPTPYANLWQLLGFQAVWWAWALGIPAGLMWPGVLISLVFLGLHGLWRPQAQADRRAVGCAVLAGAVMDSLLMQTGLLTFAMGNPAPLADLQPGWMALLWACLGCTVHHSLAWLKGRVVLAAGLSAVSGVLSYEGAARLGALALPQPMLAWALLAVFWAAFLPWVQHPRAPHDKHSGPDKG